MEPPLVSETSFTLLGRLCHDPTDQAAWARFIDVYGPKIGAWCRRWGLQDADVEDVTQDVLVRLATRMRDFRYDASKSFRGWLKTLTHHAWSDFIEGRRRQASGSGDSGVLDLLETVEARVDMVRRLEEAFDHELLEEAMARVQVRVAARTWEAFRLTALEGLSGAEAAGRLGMKVAHVFVAKSEVQGRLREEVRRLEAPHET